MKGVVLAGGTGSRLRPITQTGPKQLIPVANRPIIAYVIEDLRGAGITDIGVVLGNNGRDAIRAYLGDGSDFDVDITYIVQGEPRGIAHACSCARDFVDGDDFVLYLGDNLLEGGIKSILEEFEAGTQAATIALKEVEDPHQFGVASLDTDGDLDRVVEKPDDPSSNLALVGVYVFSNAIFGAIDALEPSERDELEITDAIQQLLDRGDSIATRQLQGWWKDVGTPADVLAANRLVLDQLAAEGQNTPAVDRTAQGSIDIHRSASITDGARVEGPVSIAAGSTIEDGAVIGPYTAIGPGCTIRRSEISKSVIFGETVITADRHIRDSLVGRNCLIRESGDETGNSAQLVVGDNANISLDTGWE